jgi:uncharacterized membrane protein YbhN (UPF0104 family)
VARRVASVALRLTVSIALLALVTLVVADPGDIVARLRGMRGLPLLLAVLLTVADRVLMAVKWRVLLTARGVPMPLALAVRAYFASSLAGLFLPVTVGADAVRIFASRQYGAADVTASIVVERVIGAASVIVVALAGVALIAGALADAAFRAIVIAVAVTGLGVALAFPASLWLAGRWAASKGSGENGRSVVQRIAAAYSAYRGHPGTLSAFFVLSLIESTIPGAIAAVAARGLSIDAPVWIFLAAMPIALMVARLPVSLGGFGVQELSFVYVTGLLGVGASEAAATMLVVDAVLVLTLLPAAFDLSILNRPGLQRRTRSS